MVLGLFSLGSFLLYWKNYNFFVLVSRCCHCCVCVCACVHACVGICARACTSVHASVLQHLQLCVHARVCCTYVRMFVHACVVHM